MLISIQYNYTGLIIGVDVVKAKIIAHFAMESGLLAPQSDEPLINGGGGGAGMCNASPAEKNAEK